jgi:transcriptional regulator with XRE-family HTH domain
MAKRYTLPAELKNLGWWVSQARTKQSLTQKELATKASLSQPRLSGIEKGAMLPTLPQLIRLSQALALPLQWFLNGSVRPGTETRDFAIQLEWLGIVDLLVPEAVVPGAFRPTEQVLALAVSGDQPNPRIIQAIPAVLAWNRWSASRLREYSKPRASRACIRLAWLADVALTIHRTTGFPGSCPQYEQLEKFVGPLSKARLPLKNDDLGRPGEEGNLPPVSKRWMITYDAPLSSFIERASHLLSFQLKQRRLTKQASNHSNDG